MPKRNGLPDPAGFLPGPAVPTRPRTLPDTATVAAYAGDLAAPLARIDDAIAAADAAVADLEAARPGGRRYTDDLAADVADRVADRTPKAVRLDKLLDGDRRRWVAATIACQAAAEITRTAAAKLDRPAIATAVRKVVDKAAAEWANAATAGWFGRADKLAAWEHRRDGEDALGTYWAALAVWSWATGTGGRAPEATRPVRVPDVDGLPPGPSARGTWLALELALEPDSVWLHLPTGVVWPDGAEATVLKALPDSGRQFADLANHGAHPVALDTGTGSR
ncbi:hypothetical protein GON03_03915 [Nocardioides sp. MAH-18]|uniref:Uncharacterized protein n=1 Tax=Nocardioides agri TaxID=2682843 RepID=A0A6L6XRS2_9ACTN|nr:MULTISPECIES: hypothetical protein [unclassified Nocardioides]MBA2953447.1 hypothetical protein [Nocardioides sp. CGMCC 1.13656]MVQ48315.1 hypothetical protein [Nocardioides sp. MAH-18]